MKKIVLAILLINLKISSEELQTIKFNNNSGYDILFSGGSMGPSFPVKNGYQEVKLDEFKLKAQYLLNIGADFYSDHKSCGIKTVPNLLKFYASKTYTISTPECKNECHRGSFCMCSCYFTITES